MPDGVAGKGPAGSVGSAWAPASAMLMIVAGIVLAGAGFVVDPLGELSDSVLWFVSQGLIYAGAIFGVAVSVSARHGGVRRV